MTYDEQDVKIIAIAGGSGSGKTTTALRLQTMLGEENCKILSQDNYYHDQSAKFKGDGSINYDHPDAIDFALMGEHFKELLKNHAIQVPIYSFVTHKREVDTFKFKPKKIIIVDGILLLAQEDLKPFFYASIFLDLPEEVRFARRLRRDVEERGREPEGVKLQFFSIVKPMHDTYVQPSKRFATYVVMDDKTLEEAMYQLTLKIT